MLKSLQNRLIFFTCCFNPGGNPAVLPNGHGAKSNGRCTVDASLHHFAAIIPKILIWIIFFPFFSFCRLWCSTRPYQRTTNERQWYDSYHWRISHTLSLTHTHTRIDWETAIVNLFFFYVSGYGAQAGGYGGQGTKGKGISDVMMYLIIFEFLKVKVLIVTCTIKIKLSCTKKLFFCLLPQMLFYNDNTKKVRKYQKYKKIYTEYLWSAT